jgi:hypothetical protein
MSTDNPHVIVQHLCFAEGVIRFPPNEQPVVTVPIRPDPLNWWWSAILLLCGLLAATIGCSAKVEVESENWGASPASISPESQVSTGEKARTTVEVDLLQARPSEPPPSPKPNTAILNLGDGDIHVHDAPAHAEADGKPACPPRRSTFNTKIGWPSTYWQHGPSAFLGSIAVWVLVGTAVVSMMATVGRKEGGPMFTIIGLLVLAAVILQALPATESGLQFYPLLPWCYSGVVAICLSLLCWAGILLAALIAMLRSGLIGAPSGFSTAVLFSMGCGLLLSLGGGSAPTEVASAVNRAPVSSSPQLATEERGRTAVPVDRLQPRSQEPIPSPKPPEQQKPVPSEAKPINISGNTVVFSFRGGDSHNETHIHVQESPPPRVEERITVRREAEPKPPRPVDDRCERMAREHEERVRSWKAFPGG